MRKHIICLKFIFKIAIFYKSINIGLFIDLFFVLHSIFIRRVTQSSFIFCITIYIRGLLYRYIKTRLVQTDCNVESQYYSL